jgi:hypothetical protein
MLYDNRPSRSAGTPTVALSWTCKRQPPVLLVTIALVSTVGLRPPLAFC